MFWIAGLDRVEVAAGAFADDEAPAAEALDSIVSEARALERNAEKRRRQA